MCILCFFVSIPFYLLNFVVSFPRFGENSSIVSLNNFSAPHSTFFLSGTLMIHMLDLLLLSHSP